MSALDPAWLDELSELLRIQSVSADPAHADDLVRAAEWVADKIRRGGGEAELVPYGERPLVVGEIRASSGAESAPTILCYGHFDVQPPAPLDLWESDPFEARSATVAARARVRRQRAALDAPARRRTACGRRRPSDQHPDRLRR
jgi:acetylornithine deacetylase/succinyl-diaminopimelate desuccinylase-like protein